MSLASIIGPLVFSSFYFIVRDQWPGAIWLSALAVNAIAVPLVFGLRFQGVNSASNVRDEDLAKPA